MAAPMPLPHPPAALLASVHRVVATTLAAPGIDDVVDLVDARLLDSLALVEIVLALEQAFQISIPLQDLQVDDFRTVRRIGAVVTQCLPSGLPREGRQD